MALVRSVHLNENTDWLSPSCTTHFGKVSPVNCHARPSGSVGSFFWVAVKNVVVLFHRVRLPSCKPFNQFHVPCCREESGGPCFTQAMGSNKLWGITKGGAPHSKERRNIFASDAFIPRGQNRASRIIKPMGVKPGMLPQGKDGADKAPVRWWVRTCPRAN